MQGAPHRYRQTEFYQVFFWLFELIAEDLSYMCKESKGRTLLFLQKKSINWSKGALGNCLVTPLNIVCNPGPILRKVCKQISKKDVGLFLFLGIVSIKMCIEPKQVLFFFDKKTISIEYLSIHMQCHPKDSKYWLSMISLE